MNKFSFLVVTILISNVSVFAASEELYNAINAPETGLPSQDVNILGKSIGGLSCTKVTDIYPGATPKYSCSLDTQSLDAEIVFNNLNLQIKDGSHGAIGASNQMKTAGGLECHKITVIYPGATPNYSCRVQF